MHASKYEALMVSCHKSSQCYGTRHCLSMSETHMSTEVGHRVYRQLPRSVIKSGWLCMTFRGCIRWWSAKVWVVVHDLQRVHPMVVCHRVWPIILGGIQVDVMTWLILYVGSPTSDCVDMLD